MNLPLEIIDHNDKSLRYDYLLSLDKINSEKIDNIYKIFNLDKHGILRILQLSQTIYDNNCKFMDVWNKYYFNTYVYKYGHERMTYDMEVYSDIDKNGNYLCDVFSGLYRLRRDIVRYLLSIRFLEINFANNVKIFVRKAVRTIEKYRWKRKVKPILETIFSKYSLYERGLKDKILSY